MTLASTDTLDSETQLLRDAFSGNENPLRQEWLAGLAGDIRKIAIIAQQCLLGRDLKSIIEAARQIEYWEGRFLNDHKHASPALLLKEDIGRQLQLGPLIDLLLSKESFKGFKKYEYVAVTVLIKTSVLANIIGVYGHGEESIRATQSISLQIARLHTALLLFRAIDETPAEKQPVLKRFVKGVFSEKAGKAGAAKSGFRKLVEPSVRRLYEKDRTKYDTWQMKQVARSICKCPELGNAWEVRPESRYYQDKGQEKGLEPLVYKIVQAIRKERKNHA